MVRVIKLTSFLLIIFLNTSNKKIEKSTNCNAVLKAEKNRSVKSVKPGRSVSYRLVLTNTSETSKTFVVTKDLLKESCYTDSGRSLVKNSTKNNVYLTTKIHSKTFTKKNNTNHIVLKAKESKEIEVNISASKEIILDSWACTKIKVHSLDCNKEVASIILKTYVINPLIE